jgi:hypothetical protein
VDATAERTQGATVWFDRRLPADVELSFEVHVVDAVGSANNMNLLFQFRDPQNASLHPTRGEESSFLEPPKGNFADLKYGAYLAGGVGQAFNSSFSPLRFGTTRRINATGDGVVWTRSTLYRSGREIVTKWGRQQP